MISTCVILATLAAAPAMGEPSHVWTRQLGGGGSDYGTGVAADGLSNVYLCGSTWTSLQSGVTPSPLDPYVAKYNSAGILQWVRQPQADIGWSEEAYGVAADRHGNVWLAGCAEDGSNIFDGWVNQYDGSGDLVANAIINAGGRDGAAGVAADGAGNAYVCGWTDGALDGSNLGASDAFVAKYDDNCNRAWVRQFGTNDIDKASAVACDADGNAYVTGYVRVYDIDAGVHSLDVIVRKYSSGGTLRWSKQFGSQWGDWGAGIACDDLGHVYVAGVTMGHLFDTSLGGEDAFLMKLDSDNGSQVWARQFGTSDDDRAQAVDVDAAGKAYVGGNTWGDFGLPNQDYTDLFRCQFSSSGTMVWSQQLGTEWFDSSNGVSVDGLVVYFGGDSGGLVYPAAGDLDAHVSKYIIPEPCSAALLAIGVVGLKWFRRRRRAR